MTVSRTNRVNILLDNYLPLGEINEIFTTLHVNCGPNGVGARHGWFVCWLASCARACVGMGDTALL